MKKLLTIFLAFSLGLNAYLILKEMDVIIGGGIHKQSPSEEYTIMVNSQRNANPIKGDTAVYAEITVHEGFIADEVIQRIRVNPISTEDETAYRNLKDPIVWSDDEAKATVTTPDFILTINMNPESVGIANDDAESVATNLAR